MGDKSPENLYEKRNAPVKRLTLLIDTNVLIPLEPTLLADVGTNSTKAFELAELAQQVGAILFVHPSQKQDLNNDKNVERRTLRLSLVAKYPALPSPPPFTRRVADACGNPQPGSNSWIDGQLVSTLDHNAVAFLVTEDREIHRACRRLGIDSRCLGLAAAVDLLNGERVIPPPAPPAIQAVFCHELDERDPFFQSLRTNYSGFDTWLQKCKREHRQAWIAKLPGRPNLAGLCIVNREDGQWPDTENPTLKLCTFKIANDSVGLKLGELLLRTIFDFARKNSFSTLFVETYPKHGALLRLFDQFGFEPIGHKGTADEGSELVLRKRLSTKFATPSLSALEFNRLFGPFAVKWEGVQTYIVPIEPRFHAALFPEMEPQGSLFAGTQSYGNTLRKAYICRAQIRAIRPGDMLLFYRSGDQRCVTTIGVVEDTLFTNVVEEMRRLVANRTVFGDDDLQEICRADGGLGILFRHAPVLTRPIPLDAMLTNRVLSAPPQSIVTVRPSSLQWIQTYL